MDQYSVSVSHRATDVSSGEKETAEGLGRSHWWRNKEKHVTHHSLCSRVPNSLKARSMETDESRKNKSKKKKDFAYLHK